MFALPVAKPLSPDRHPPAVAQRPRQNLEVGAVNDPSEREADSIAGVPAATQTGEPASREAPISVDKALRSPGQPLDATTRAYFEPRLGRELSDVRVHADDLAGRSAQAMNAQAYTVGSHIVFGAGRFDAARFEGRQLLAHELAHVVQQQAGTPVLRRQPEKKPAQKLEPFKPVDQVVDLRTEVSEDGQGEWILTLDGHTSPESAGRALWPQRVPFPVDIKLDMALFDPIERGVFKISGIDERALGLMEPSIVPLFRARLPDLEARLAEVATENAKIDAARDAFRKKHEDLGEWRLRTIDFALRKATKGNPDLRLAFYNYYADAGFGLMSSDTRAGETSGGDTEINRSVMLLASGFPTDDPVALLGATLIHEFVHTPQGSPGALDVKAARNEAKAYGIERFFAERMGDEAREERIGRMYEGNDIIDVNMKGDVIFNQSYDIISRLYEIIDGPDRAEAAKARAMSVEFISKNASDFGPELRAFIARHVPKGYFPM